MRPHTRLVSAPGQAEDASEEDAAVLERLGFRPPTDHRPSLLTQTQPWDALPPVRWCREVPMRIARWTTVAALVLVLAPLLLAERPSLPWVRDAEATHILVGKVKAVYEQQLQTSRQGPGTIEGHYLVEIEVSKVERGKGYAPKDIAYVRCWQIAKSGGRITPGASGHGPIPVAGHHVRAYVAKGPYGPTGQEDQGLSAVYPNGFEILDPEALRSKATRPVVTYEWPPWAEDLDPDRPGAQPGFDIQAKDAYPKRRENPGLRYIRMRITPGRNADGSLRKIRSFQVDLRHRPTIVDEAYVASATSDWKTIRAKNGRRFSFSATTDDAFMPEAGLVFVFVVKAEALASATWRSAGFLLTSTPGEPSFQDQRNPSRVTHLNWTRNPGPTGPVDIPVQLPCAR